MTMQDSYFHIVMAISAIIALSLHSMTALRGWQGWLELRRAELERRPDGTSAATTARIEVADLKARVRRLAAIAAGVDVRSEERSVGRGGVLTSIVGWSPFI